MPQRPFSHTVDELRMQWLTLALRSQVKQPGILRAIWSTVDSLASTLVEYLHHGNCQALQI